MKGSNLTTLKSDLAKLDWSKTLLNMNASDQFDLFHGKLIKLLDEHCPEKTCTIPNKRVIKEPWLTKGLLNCINKQQALYKKFLQTKTEPSERKYKNYRNMLRKILCSVKRKFYQDQCYRFRKDLKKLWSMINSITGKTNDKSTAISSIKVANIERTDSHSICNEFGKYFSTVGQKLANKIGKSNTSIQDYIEKITRNERSVFLNPCTSKEILNLINKLHGKRSSGHDGVSNVLVKELKYELVTPLEIIFNNSLLTGQFPTLMKHTEVVPLFKSGFRNQTTNYRPISLLLTI